MKQEKRRMVFERNLDLSPALRKLESSQEKFSLDALDCLYNALKTTIESASKIRNENEFRISFYRESGDDYKLEVYEVRPETDEEVKNRLDEKYSKEKERYNKYMKERLYFDLNPFNQNGTS
jgi:hypothetical protein